MMQIKRGRLSVTLGDCAQRFAGLETLGTVTHQETRYALATDNAGSYFSIDAAGIRASLNPVKVQGAIAETVTGVKQLSQADRMALNAIKKQGNTNAAKTK